MERSSFATRSVQFAFVAIIAGAWFFLSESGALDRTLGANAARIVKRMPLSPFLSTP